MYELMNMAEISLDYNSIQIEEIADVGIIVTAHFENPLQQKMIEFIGNIIQGKKNIIVPLSSFISAYFVLTTYLKVSRYQAKTTLFATLEKETPLFSPRIDDTVVMNAIDISSVYNLESWDRFLVELANLFAASHMYTIDKNYKN